MVGHVGHVWAIDNTYIKYMFIYGLDIKQRKYKIKLTVFHPHIAQTNMLGLCCTFIYVSRRWFFIPCDRISITRLSNKENIDMKISTTQTYDFHS